MPRILIYSPDAGSRPGHSFSYAVRVCDGLIDKGNDVVLVTSTGFIDTHREVYGNCPRYEVFEDPSTDFSNTLVQTSPVKSVLYIYRRIRQSLRILRFLDSKVKESQADVLHWLDNPEIFTTGWYALRRSKRVASGSRTTWWLNIHPGDLLLATSWSNPLRKLYKIYSRFMFRFLLKSGRVDGVFVHGDWIKEQLVTAIGQFSENRIFVAPYGTDPPVTIEPSARLASRRELGIPESSRVALSFGMIRRDKDLESVMRAVALVPEIVLLVVGMPAEIDAATIEGWVKGAGIEDRTVLRLGYVPEGKVSEIFAAADISVLAHKKGFAAQSGPLHLACTYLTPIIASDVGEVGLYVRQHQVGELYPPGDSAALADRLRLLAGVTGDSSDRFEEIRANQVQLGNVDNWDSMISRYLDVYREFFS